MAMLPHQVHALRASEEPARYAHEPGESRGRRGRDGRRWRRAAGAFAGWLEVSDDGAATWSLVPPGSGSIPSDVRRAYLEPR